MKKKSYIVNELAMDSSYDNSYENPCLNNRCPEPKRPRFCCTISVPEGLTVIPKTLKAAIVSGEGFKIRPDRNVEKEVCGCKIKLNTVRIDGCAKVFVSVGVKDPSGNISHLCCSSCAFFDDVRIICCDSCKNDYSDITFKAKFYPIKQVCICNDDYDDDECDTEDAKIPSLPVKPCGETIYQITGKIITTCKK